MLSEVIEKLIESKSDKVKFGLKLLTVYRQDIHKDLIKTLRDQLYTRSVYGGYRSDAECQLQ